MAAYVSLTPPHDDKRGVGPTSQSFGAIRRSTQRLEVCCYDTCRLLIGDEVEASNTGSGGVFDELFGDKRSEGITPSLPCPVHIACVCIDTNTGVTSSLANDRLRR